MPSSPRSEPVSFCGRHLFITGGTGFLGRSLLDYLREAVAVHGDDLRVTVLTRDPARFQARHPEYAGLRWLNFVTGDLDHLLVLPERITDLIHAAADTHRAGGDKLDWLDQLVVGTRHVLDYVRDGQVERMVYVSSGAVYGAQPADVAQLAEDWPHAPLPGDTASVYGTGKRMAEHLCTLYGEQYGLQCVMARCFAILSRHIPFDGAFAAGNFLRDALTRDSINVRGDGAAIRTYMDGRDCAHWLLTLLKRGTGGQAYNVGSDQPVSVLELARQIGAQLAPGKLIVVERTEPVGARSVYVPNIAKAEALGLAIETPLLQAITDSAAGRSIRAAPSTAF